MKSILKALVCLSLILVSKLTKEDEATTSGTAVETDKKVESSFINYRPQAELLHEAELLKDNDAEIEKIY